MENVLAIENTIELKTELLERVAKLVACGVENHQIAIATGLNEERVLQMVETGEFKNVLTTIEMGRLEESQELNDGYDALERKAILTSLEYMNTTNDADYAVKVMRVANAAQRRGSGGNKPINGNGIATATITLSVEFIKQLQNMNKEPNAMSKQGKRVDSMLPGAVAELLTQGKETADDFVNRTFRNVDVGEA